MVNHMLYLLQDHTDGLVQDCSISSALAMEILQSCTESSICSIHIMPTGFIIIAYCHRFLCWLIFSSLSWTPRNKLENIGCEIPSILFMHHCAKWSPPLWFQEADEDELEEDELPPWKKPQPKIDLSSINPDDPESMLQTTKKGQTLMMFATVSGKYGMEDIANCILQTGLDQCLC